MNVLAIDCSTEILSLAARSGEKTFEMARNVDLRHSEELVPAADHALAQVGIQAKRLDLVVVARGPGSFTGLRIGFASAKGFCAGAECPLVSVPTLDVYAAPFAFLPGTSVVPAIDAKKKRFYVALYREGERSSDYLDAAPEEVSALTSGCDRVILTGPHASLLRPFLKGDRFLLDPCGKNGKGLLLLDLGVDAFKRGMTDEASTAPLYIRASEAKPGDGGGMHAGR